MEQQRLPIVDQDDGSWGAVLNQYIEKEHYNADIDLDAATSENGGHKKITIQPGTATAGTAPLKFMSGTLLGTPEAGTIEFVTDDLYFTQTTSTVRKKVTTYNTNTNANLTVGNTIEGYVTTATAASTTSLVAGDKYQQYFTGSTTQTVLMPVAANCIVGQQWQIINNSTGADAAGLITIQTSDGAGNTILVLAAGSYVTLTCILASGTTIASWSYSQNSLHVTVSKTQPTQNVYGDVWIDIT